MIYTRDDIGTTVNTTDGIYRLEDVSEDTAYWVNFDNGREMNLLPEIHPQLALNQMNEIPDELWDEGDDITNPSHYTAPVDRKKLFRGIGMGTLVLGGIALWITIKNI